MLELQFASAFIEIIVTVVTVTWFVSRQIANLTAVSLENRRLVERIIAEQRDVTLKELNHIALRLQRLEISLGLNGTRSP